MENIALALIGIILALGYIIDKATKFIKELKSSKKSFRLKNGFEAKISVAPIATKKEVCASIHTTSKQ